MVDDNNNNNNNNDNEWRRISWIHDYHSYLYLYTLSSHLKSLFGVVISDVFSSQFSLVNVCPSPNLPQ